MVHEHPDELVVHGLGVRFPSIVQLQHLLVSVEDSCLVLMVVQLLDLALLFRVMVQSLEGVTPQFVRHSGAICSDI